MNPAAEVWEKVKALMGAEMTATTLNTWFDDAEAVALEESRFAALAEQYRQAGDVLLFEDGLSPDGLRRLCDAVLHACGGQCACFSGDDSSGYKYAVGQLNGDLRDLVKELNQTLNGRGGGKDDFVQGSVQASRSEIKAFFQAAIREGTAP